MRRDAFVNLGLTLGLGALAILTCASPAAAVGASVALCAGALTLRYLPDIGMLKIGFFIVVALVPLDSLGQMENGFVMNLTLTKLIFLPIFALMVVDRVLGRRPFVSSRQGLLAVGLLACMLLSALLNEAHFYTLPAMRRYVGVVLLLLLGVNLIETERDIRILLGVILVSCFASAAIGVFEHYTGITLMGITTTWAGEGQRLVGASTHNPNTFATNVLVAMFIALYFFFIARSWVLRAVLAAMILVLLLAITLSLSRAVTLVMILSTVHLLVRIRRRVSLPAALGFLLLAGLCALPLIPSAYYERLVTLVTETHTDMSLLRRQAYNQIGWALFTRSPLWGVGPGNFREFYMSEEFRYITDTFKGPRILHNMYLSFACEMGLLGLSMLVLLIVATFRDFRFVRRSYQNGDDSTLKQASEALEIAFAAFLMSSLFLPNEFQKYLWILFAASAAMAHMRRIQLRNAQPADHSTPDPSP